LYLKRHHHGGLDLYSLRESYCSGDCWKHRTLIDLGPDPGAYIEYPGGNSFYIRESLEEELRRLNADYASGELEALFIPFLDPSIRRVIERFQRPEAPQSRWRGRSPEELLRRHGALHSFDKRRLHYLRFGRVHIGNLEARPWTFLNVLLDKSRDEIETLLGDMELALPPNETYRYLYTAFGLEIRFRQMLTRYRPEALDPFKVEAFFLQDLCRLNQDKRFFSGVDDHDPALLHPYLRKYVILYFDNPFDPRILYDDDVADFVRSRQFYKRSGASSGPMSESEKQACTRLGITVAEFGKMDRRELIRLYRRSAMKSHPDKGGEKEIFVRMKAAYECLLKRKT
jgi:hypothetical protein